jgi:hypothetical protein
MSEASANLITALLSVIAILLFAIMVWLAAIFGKISGAIERYEKRLKVRVSYE